MRRRVPPLQAPWVVEGSRPPQGWPLKGEVEFRNYSVRYRPGLELVLKNLSLRVSGGEKVPEGPGRWARAGAWGGCGCPCGRTSLRERAQPSVGCLRGGWGDPAMPGDLLASP